MNTKMRKGFVVLLIVAAALVGCANEDAAAAPGYGRYQSADGSVGGGLGRGAGGGNGRGTPGISIGGAVEDYAGETASLIADLPVQDLSAAEIESLLFMWEEEKLARDVYTALYETWNLPIFSSIAASEQTHMDSIAILMERYALDNPAAEEADGAYNNPELQMAYIELLSSGRESLAAALTVGATIEDLDIADLQAHIELSDNDDIRVVYQNLMKGSRNHIRSFISQLDRLGESYQAAYISADYLERVLAISRETAPITDPVYSL